MIGCNDFLESVRGYGESASYASIDKVVKELEGSGNVSADIYNFAGSAHLLTLDLAGAYNFFSKSKDEIRLSELKDVALWYGGNIHVVQALANSDEFHSYLKTRALQMIPVYHDEQGFYSSNCEYEKIVSEIGNAGMNPAKVMRDTVTKMVEFDYQNKPALLFLAKKLGDEPLIRKATIDFNIRKYLSRSKTLERLSDYAHENNLVMTKILQQGDTSDFFPNSSFLVAMNNGHGTEVYKEHIRFQLDFGHMEGYNQEKELLETMNHDSLIKYNGSMFYEGQEFLKMEYFEGKELTDFIDGSLPIHQSLDYSRKIADFLDYSHGIGIQYRDVKPKNILVNGDALKILDLGMAMKGEVVNSLLSTPRYMPPEMISNFTSYKSSDIFQLGIVMYELLTGSHPFMKTQFKEGPGNRQSELVMYGLPNLYSAQKRSAILERNPGLCRLVSSMLEKDHSNRPTAKDVSREIGDLL